MIKAVAHAVAHVEVLGLCVREQLVTHATHFKFQSLGPIVLSGPWCGTWAPQQGKLWSLGPLVFSMSPLLPQAPIMVLRLIAHCSPRAPLWSMLPFRVPVPVVIPWSHCDPLYPICSPDSLSHMWVIGPLAFPGPSWSQGPVTAQGSIRIPWPCCGLQAPIVVPGPSCGPWAPVWSSFPL